MRLPMRVRFLFPLLAVLIAFTPLRPPVEGAFSVGAECTTCCPSTGSKCIVCTTDCVEVSNAYDNGPGKCPVPET